MGRLKTLAKSLEKGGKSLLRGSLIKLLRAPRRPDAPLDPNGVRRVLVVRHDARLGNLLLLTPALRLIKRAFPDARVDVLLADKYGDALKFNPSVDEVLTARSLPGLRGRGYDLAFDFSPLHAFSLSSALWTAASGAKRRIGYDRGDAAKFLDDPVPTPAARAHETANLARLVRHAAPGADLPGDAPTEDRVALRSRRARRRGEDVAETGASTATPSRCSSARAPRSACRRSGSWSCAAICAGRAAASR